MTEVAYKQIMARLDIIEERMATKDDIAHMATKSDLADLEKRMATKDDIGSLKSDITRLERKMDSYHEVNINHHLEARSMIGDVNKHYTHLREGLLKAAGAG